MIQALHINNWVVYKIYGVSIGLLLVFFSIEGWAQPAQGVKSVDIVSAYKPSVRKVSKFQFLPNLPTPDNSRVSLRYAIPTQGWQSEFKLKPVMPLAYQTDSSKLHTTVYIKAGYGNLKSPYFRAHFSKAIDQYTAYAISTYHQSAKGKQLFQQFAHTGVFINGTKKLSNRPFTVDGNIEFNRQAVYKYGFPTGVAIPAIDSIKNIVTEAGGRVGFSRSVLTDFGLSYQGDLFFNSFSDQAGGRELAVRLRLPLQKFIEENWSIGLAVDLQTIQLKREITSLRNNSMGLLLGVKHANGRLNFNAGINPVWDKTGGQLLPQVSVTYKLDSSRLMLVAGWEGKFVVNTYQQLFSTNNWINIPLQLFNTKTKEAYIGLNGALSPYFTYAVRGAGLTHQNMPLFVNDTSQLLKNAFKVVFEPRMVQLQIKGEINYQMGQRIHLYSALQLNKFNALVEQEKAWGLLPIEWKSGSRVLFGKNFSWQTDLYIWRGAQFLQTGRKLDRLKGAADLSTQLEFQFAKSWQLWTRVGNIFNQSYQRWAQYPVYGFNFMAGVVFSPDPKRKP
ncbi:MAG: hypothetical protein FJY19_01230 [Bacteroidetes bacterium]|nr:hypothetical protein [Bacteroidota bacterium]